MTTLIVTTDHTIDKGETISADNDTAVDIQAAVTLTNKGTISVTGDSGYIFAIEIESTGASFVNAKGGRFLMTTTGQDANAFGVVVNADADVINNGVFQMRSDTSCNGFEFDGGGGSMVNTGRVDIQAGTEFMSLGAIFNRDGVFENQGQFSVTSHAGACLARFEDGGSFDNTSEMVSHGDGLAYGVIVMDGAAEISNSGEITVTDNHLDSLNPAAGVYLQGHAAGHIVNAGTITATNAIWAYDQATVDLENTGTLIGDVVLADLGDRIENAGMIAGNIDMGAGKDVYLGIKRGDVAGEIHGGGGNDQLTGDARADHFFGDAGNDLIQGGKNADVLSGGSGADSFIYTDIKDSKNAHADLITDLDASDLIDLSLIDADTTQDGDQAFTRVEAFDGHAGELTVSYHAKTDVTRIAVDVDGNGAPDATILVSGDHTDFAGFVL